MAGYMMPLLFSTVVIHAYHVRSTAYHHIFALATVLSVCESYALLKKLAGYFIFFWVMEMHVPKVDSLWVVLFPVSLILLWVVHGLFPARTTHLPAAMCLLGVVETHLYLQL